MLVVELSDESGINISNSGFDRGITLTLNDEIIELNDFYVAEIDDFTQGTVMYPFQGLEPGRYTAIIKATDTYNNPASKSVDFVVSDQPIFQAYNFKAYPNPASTVANFTFEHDREGEPLRASITLYAMDASVVLQHQEEIDFGSRSEMLTLNLKDRIIKDGMYLYRILVSSLVDGASTAINGRLVIRN